MNITSEDQQVSSKVQETKICVATSGLSGRGHLIVRWHTGLSDATRGLSGAPGNCSPMASFWWHWWREATGLSGVTYGLSGVTRGLSGVKACSANDHLWCQIQRLGTLDRGTGLSGVPQRATAFLQRLKLCWGL
jgi:hypothetical protein